MTNDRFLRMKHHVIPAHLVPFIFKFCRKEFPFFHPWHKDMVAFPQVQIQYLFIRDPFQPAFGRINCQFAAEFGRGEDKDVPIIALEFGETSINHINSDFE